MNGRANAAALNGLIQRLDNWLLPANPISPSEQLLQTGPG